MQEFGTDLLAVKAYANESVLGPSADAAGLASSGSEQNTFFGVPLLYVLLGVAVVLARSASGTGVDGHPGPVLVDVARTAREDRR